MHEERWLYGTKWRLELEVTVVKWDHVPIKYKVLSLRRG